jgi:hypothetical protein
MPPLSTRPKRVNERHVCAALARACNALGLPCEFDTEANWATEPCAAGTHAVEYVLPGEIRPSGVTIFTWAADGTLGRAEPHQAFIDAGLTRPVPMTHAWRTLNMIAARARQAKAA